jgi:hypothetical protein
LQGIGDLLGGSARALALHTVKSGFAARLVQQQLDRAADHAKFPRKAGLCHRIDFLRVQPRRLIAAL